MKWQRTILNAIEAKLWVSLSCYRDLIQNAVEWLKQLQITCLLNEIVTKLFTNSFESNGPRLHWKRNKKMKFIINSLRCSRLHRLRVILNFMTTVTPAELCIHHVKWNEMLEAKYVIEIVVQTVSVIKLKQIPACSDVRRFIRDWKCVWR